MHSRTNIRLPRYALLFCGLISSTTLAHGEPTIGNLQRQGGVIVSPPVRRGGEVRIVAPSGGDFTTIQAAVNAAAPGDTVLVKHGSYAGFTINGKGINVVEEAGTFAGTSGAWTIMNVPAGQVAFVSGLHQERVNVFNNAGAVRIEGLTGLTSGSACVVSNSADVCIAGTTLAASNGFAPYFDGDWALTITSSKVTLYHSKWTGGRGGDANLFDDEGRWDATHGGRGMSLSGASFLFAAGCQFKGGDGGNAECQAPYTGAPGNGGDGAGISSTSIRLACTTTGGTAGTACLPGVDGQPGNFTTALAGTAPKMQLATPVRDNSVVPISFVGAPGDFVSLFISRSTTRVYEPDLRGVRMVDGPYSAILYMGIVPPSGVLEQTLRLDDAWTPPHTATLYFAQAVFADTGGGVTLGNAVPLVVLDSVY